MKTCTRLGAVGAENCLFDDSVIIMINNSMAYWFGHNIENAI